MRKRLAKKILKYPARYHPHQISRARHYMKRIICIWCEHPVTLENNQQAICPSCGRNPYTGEIKTKSVTNKRRKPQSVRA